VVPLLLGVKMVVPLVGIHRNQDITSASVGLVVDVPKLQVVENCSLENSEAVIVSVVVISQNNISKRNLRS
jgi:hypothetical protein